VTPFDHALSEVLGSMVAEHDVANTLDRLVEVCCAAYPSDAVAVMARNGGGDLELLSASSYGMETIELLQIQNDQGPCADVIHSSSPIGVSGADALVERWPEIGTALVSAGFDGVHAYPLRWRGQTIGGLNIFLRGGAAADEPLGQLFADLATLALLQSDHLTTGELVARVHGAVSARAVIEQAKGILSHREGLDMDQAHRRLVEAARAQGLGISAVAGEVIAGAYDDPGGQQRR
jgi:hypothetical protein